MAGRSILLMVGWWRDWLWLLIRRTRVSNVMSSRLCRLLWLETTQVLLLSRGKSGLCTGRSVEVEILEGRETKVILRSRRGRGTTMSRSHCEDRRLRSRRSFGFQSELSGLSCADLARERKPEYSLCASRMIVTTSTDDCRLLRTTLGESG